MNKTLTTILAVLGILAIIAIIYNWRKIFPITVVTGTGERTGFERYGENPHTDNGQLVCKVSKQDGSIVEIKGEGKEFEDLCRYANTRNYSNPYFYQGYYYWPYYYHFIKPKPGTNTGTGSGGGGTSTPTIIA